ncbi:MAG: preprotein translocase subunit YajC [Chthoniobacterales bacterium]|nr:preprotein translocase subunit YajC [Chthoniobacterales bacterium]
MLFLFLAQAAPAAPASPASSLVGLLPIVFIFVIGYYVMIRPQMKRQKEQARLVSALKTGDDVITTSGIHGRITNVKETTVIVKVADNVKLEMEKSAVTNVLKPSQA